MKLLDRDVQHAINLERLHRFRDAGVEFADSRPTLCLRPTGDSTSTGVAACQP